MSRPFADWCALNFPTPTDSLAAFFDDAAVAAASVGASLDAMPEIDGRRHYLPNLVGGRDKKQFYVASVEKDPDGTAWPSITFKSYKSGAIYWRPRNLAWHQFEADRGKTTANDNARKDYRAAADAAIVIAKKKASELEQQQSEGRKAAASVAADAWQDAEPCESHPYLERKRVASYGLRIAKSDRLARLWNDDSSAWQSIAAVRAGDLLVPVHDVDGNLVNVQRIDANGRKRFIMGGHAHGCHFRIEGRTRRVALVEGYATGASWCEATGDTVVLAFSAGALPVVAGYIRADIVAADNDVSQAGEQGAKATGLRYIMPPVVGDWNDYAAAHGLDGLLAAVANDNTKAFVRPYLLPLVELKGREQTWWNKLSNAETPDYAAVLAWAIARRLSVRVPVQMTLTDLIERIRQAAPTGTMNPATLEAIRATLARVLEWRKRRALAGVSMSTEAAGRHHLETVDELPELSGEDYRGVLLLSSPMGSGKTQRIGRPFADWAKHQEARFVATCHRQSLVAELANRLACDHYRETDGEYAWAVQALATCLPSVVKADHSQIFRETGFLFVDEIAQVLRSIASKVTVADKKTRADVFNALRDLVTRAICIIGADAGMDDRVLAFLESCRPGERFRVIQQPHRADGLAVHFGFGPDALATAYGEAMARLSEGERLWIGCGEKSRAIEAARVLEATGKRVLLLHGDNRDNAEQAEFWRDPETVSRAYDCLVHTSVISSGLSIEHREAGEYFTHGMLLASGATITPADAMQMLRRVRYLRSWTVAVTPNNARDIDSADAILAGMEQAADLEGLTVKACTNFDGFVAGIEADNARHRADFASGLWWALEHQGFEVNRLQLRGDGQLDADLRTTRAEIREERRAAILAALDLTEEEAKRLRERQSLTEAEQYALLRHRIKFDMGASVLDGGILCSWDEGRGPRRMDRFSAATQGLADRDDHQGDNLALHRFSKARALAYGWLFEGLELAPGLRINDAMARRLIGRVIERRYLLAFLGIVPAKWARHIDNNKDFPMPAYPVREVGEILERMGLDLKRREFRSALTWHDSPLGYITPSEGKNGRHYAHELTAESWANMETLADRRNSHRGSLVEVKPINHARIVGCFARPVVGLAFPALSIGMAYRAFARHQFSPPPPGRRAA